MNLSAQPAAPTLPLQPSAVRWLRRTFAGLVLAALLAVLQSDVPTLLSGVKGDESTYVSMAFSVAYDGDLKFKREDLERFFGLYHGGPAGIFLKQGTAVGVSWRGALPRLRRTVRPPDAGLDYGKAFIYPVVAAPFVRVFGLSGLLVFNILMLAGVIWTAVAFAWARNAGGSGTLMAMAFVLASIAPIYVLWLTSEIFNFALVFAAYALWLYKDQPSARGPAWLFSPSTDVAAALLLGLATFSKPPNALLVLPLALLLLKRRLYRRFVIVSLAFAVAGPGAFLINGMVSGDLNYQGGQRRDFSGPFPFSAPDATFASLGSPKATDDSDAESLLAPHRMLPPLRHNVVYFLVGRNAGMLPYYFPGLLAFGLWLVHGPRRDFTTGVVLLALGASIFSLLVLAPDSWAGGGGPIGNRYFLSLYPVLFFILPNVRLWEAGLAWAGGMTFLAPLMLNPFVTSKSVWQAVNTPALRMLPIELTMINDLPVRLGPAARIPFGPKGEILLYFVDPASPGPEGSGVWVRGGQTEEIIVRSEKPLSRVAIRWRSPIATHVSAEIAGRNAALDLEPGHDATTSLQVGRGVVYQRGMAYVLRLKASQGFIPAMVDPASKDGRLLGAFAELSFQE